MAGRRRGHKDDTKKWVIAVLVLFILGSLNKPGVPQFFIGIAIGGFFVFVGWKYYQSQLVSKISLAEIDGMDGLEFEKYLETVFKKIGFWVTRTCYQGDFGADLLINDRKGHKVAIQAKRWSRYVGVGAVQEVTAARGYYCCNHALILTNSFFTNQARQLAQANNVELWDREYLGGIIFLAQKQKPKGTRGERPVKIWDWELLKRAFSGGFLKVRTD